MLLQQSLAVVQVHLATLLRRLPMYLGQERRGLGKVGDGRGQVGDQEVPLAGGEEILGSLNAEDES